jgi:hypothetical protein
MTEAEFGLKSPCFPLFLKGDFSLRGSKGEILDRMLGNYAANFWDRTVISLSVRRNLALE